MSGQVTIYGLVDPRTEEVRYIGATSKALEVRLAQHLGTSHQMFGMWEERSFKNRWLQELKELGMTPHIRRLLTVPSVYAGAFEKRCIALYAARGCRLTNVVLHRREISDVIMARYRQWDREALAARAAPVPAAPAPEQEGRP